MVPFVKTINNVKGDDRKILIEVRSHDRKALDVKGDDARPSSM